MSSRIRPQAAPIRLQTKQKRTLVLTFFPQCFVLLFGGQYLGLPDPKYFHFEFVQIKKHARAAARLWRPFAFGGKMEKIHLSKRLTAIAALVPPEGGLADVGTDHGYIPIWLLQNGFSGSVFATDINAAPLERARLSADENRLADKIDFRLCNGLAAVDSAKIDTVIIAGMGGETIAAILEAAPWTHEKHLIFQPMTKSERLRLWLFENNYKVLSEHLVKDGAIYELLTATGGSDRPYSDSELLTGHLDLIRSDRLFPARLSVLISRTRRALSGLESTEKAASSNRLDDLKRELRELEDMQIQFT